MRQHAGADAPFDPLHDPSLLDQDESWYGPNPKVSGQVRVLADIDLQYSQVPPLFPRNVRYQAVHSPRGPRAHGGEEDEYRCVVLFQSDLPDSQVKWFPHDAEA